MTLKDIKSRYKVSDYKHDGKYIILHLTQTGMRFCDKFLCLLNKKGTKFYVDGQKPTADLDVLEKQINDYVSALPYDSEYYYPRLKKGLFEHHIIHDYLRTLGFKNPFHSNSNELYILEDKNIYNYSSQKIEISIIGLDVWGGLFMQNGNDAMKNTLVEEVKIQLHCEAYSWVEVKVKRDVESIKKGIESLIKPLLVSDSVYNFSKAEELVNAEGVDIIMNNINNNLLTTSVEYRTTLKKKLLEMAEKL